MFYYSPSKCQTRWVPESRRQPRSRNATKQSKIRWKQTNPRPRLRASSKIQDRFPRTKTRVKCLSRRSVGIILAVILSRLVLTIFQKATLLRNTLQTAMRNVTSHQIDRRVSELEAHSRKCPRISLSALSSPSVSFRKNTTPSQFRTPRIGTTNHMSSTPFQSTPDLPGQLSTLPDSSSCLKAFQRTPPRTHGSPMQLSSPPATVVRHSRTREISEEPRQEESEKSEDLPPSQRGDAVDGLLKLMSTTGSHDSSDAWTG